MKGLFQKLAGIFTQPPILRWLARLLANYGPRRLQLGDKLFVSRWRDVTHVLDNDAHFLIEPVNKRRIEAVSGPFFLGMDAKPQLIFQRDAGYRAMAACDVRSMHTKIAARAGKLIAAAQAGGGRIDVVNGYARLVAADTAAEIFGISGPTQADFMRVARAVFHETFLNQGGDPEITKTGIAAGKELGEWFAAEIKRRQGLKKPPQDFLGTLIELSGGNGMSDEEINWIASGYLVGAVDTTATCVANIIKEIVDDAELARTVRADAGNLRLLSGWCWEMLRRRPHNPLVVRVAGVGAAVAGKPVKPGTKVFALTLAGMQDRAAFPLPQRLDPNRPHDRYMHFGRGLHVCAGRDLNAVQIPVLVAELVKHLQPGTSDLVFEGPFPNELVVRLDNRSV